MDGTGRGLVIGVSGKRGDAQRAQLTAVAPEAEFVWADNDAALADDIGRIDIVAGSVPEAMFGKADKLVWIHSWAAGPNTQLYPAMANSDVVLTCSKGNGAIPLAEHAVMHMLMLNREAMRWIDSQSRKKWERFTHGELNGQTVGIIGTGYSGTDLAGKAKAFHMRTLGLRRKAEPAENFDKMYARDEINEFLAECDFVVVTAPLTDDTKGMLGEEQFKAMKPSAFYICFSRGGLADDAALLKALREGWIAGAGLDAHDIEPLPEDSPFWDLPNVLVTPHNGATTAATMRRGFEIFVDNLGRYVRGEPLFNIVDKEHGY